MRTYDLLADLPVQIEEYELEGLEEDVSSDFERRTTVVRLQGGGEEGVGEDVVYDSVDHEAADDAGPTLPLAGEWTLRSFARRLDTLDLFPQPPQEDVSRNYRRWAYESAALDLALQQAGEPLHAVLGRTPRPVRFVVSLRLGEPPSLEPLMRRLEQYPGLRFKLDPTSAWDELLTVGVAQTGAVELIDFKGLYEGSTVEQPADPALYRRILEAFEEVWFEDPKLTPEVRELIAARRDQITWDAAIHSLADIESLPFEPRMVNFKPSRIGSLERLLDAYDHVEAHGIGAYGGGMFELGPGRGQIQYLASLFHPDAPNDVAPGEFNGVDPPPGLPGRELAPSPAATGFGWEQDLLHRTAHERADTAA